jgi:DNA-binding response OmpR family regulator
VIVSDWVMPGMTGVELCRQVRAHPGECYTYFILLTGKRQDEEVVHSLREAGADDYLSKPLNPADIERRLEVVARMAAHRRWVPAHV